MCIIACSAHSQGSCSGRTTARSGPLIISQRSSGNAVPRFFLFGSCVTIVQKAGTGVDASQAMPSMTEFQSPLAKYVGQQSVGALGVGKSRLHHNSQNPPVVRPNLQTPPRPWRADSLLGTRMPDVVEFKWLLPKLKQQHMATSDACVRRSDVQSCGDQLGPAPLLMIIVVTTTATVYRGHSKRAARHQSGGRPEGRIVLQWPPVQGGTALEKIFSGASAPSSCGTLNGPVH